MKLDRQSFLHKLKTVHPGLASKEIISQSRSFIFMDNKIVTYNDEIAVFQPFESDLNVAVKAEAMFKVLGKLRAKEIDLEYADGFLSVMTKSTKTDIIAEAEILLPFEELPTPDTWKDVDPKFLEAIHMCGPVATTDYTQPLLQYLYINGKTVTATDSYEVLIHDLETEHEKMFLPAIVVKHLISFAPDQFSVNGSWIFFKNSDEAIFCCKTVVEEEFPEVEDIFGFEGESIDLNPCMIEMVNNAEIFAHREGEETYVNIVTKDGNMVIAGKGDSGIHRERTKIDYQGQVSFEIEPKVFIEAVKLNDSIIVGEEMIKIEGQDFKYAGSLCVD